MWRLPNRSTEASARLLPASAAWLLWAAAGASAVFWGLQLVPMDPYRPQALAETTPVTTAVAASGGWRVLQPVRAPLSPTAPSAAAAPWQLLGVAAGSAGRGSALLAQTGQPARTWMVGQSLDGQWRLQRVAPGRAWLVPVDASEATDEAVELQLVTAPGAAGTAPAVGGGAGIAASQPSAQ